MLYWTRYPVNTRYEPLSIRTGKFTVNSRFGCFRISRTPLSKWRRSATMSIWRLAVSNGLIADPSFAIWNHPRLARPREIPYLSLTADCDAQTRPRAQTNGSHPAGGIGTRSV